MNARFVLLFDSFRQYKQSQSAPCGAYLCVNVHLVCRAFVGIVHNEVAACAEIERGDTGMINVWVSAISSRDRMKWLVRFIEAA